MFRYQLTRVGPHQYMVWDVARQDFVECGSWPEILADEICDRRKECYEGFDITDDGRLVTKGAA